MTLIETIIDEIKKIGYIDFVITTVMDGGKTSNKSIIFKRGLKGNMIGEWQYSFFASVQNEDGSWKFYIPKRFTFSSIDKVDGVPFKFKQIYLYDENDGLPAGWEGFKEYKLETVDDMKVIIEKANSILAKIKAENVKEMLSEIEGDFKC